MYRIYDFNNFNFYVFFISTINKGKSDRQTDIIYFVKRNFKHLSGHIWFKICIPLTYILVGYCNTCLNYILLTFLSHYISPLRQS